MMINRDDVNSAFYAFSAVLLEASVKEVPDEPIYLL